MAESTGYPANLNVDYPERPLNRLTTFFRIFVAIPILIVIGSIAGGTPGQNQQWLAEHGMRGWGGGALATGILVFPVLLMIRYPPFSLSV